MRNIKSMARRVAPALIGSGLIAMLMACTTAEGQADGPATVRARPVDIPITNVMPDVWAFERAAAGRDKPAQVALFKDMVLRKHAELYGPVVPVPSDIAVARLIDRLPALSPAMRRLEPRVARKVADVAPRIAAFMARDGAPPPVFLMPSFFGFDGQVRPVGDGVSVLFGVDAIAANAIETGRQDVGPLIAHEFFHAWHFQTNQPLAEAARGYFVPGGAPPLYASLWFEGLATCVSRRVSPGAALPDVLLSSTLAGLPAVETRRLAGEMLAKLDSRATEDAALYLFRGGAGRAAVPERIGYLVGLLVADQVLRQVPTAQAVMLSDASLRDAVQRALQALTTGTASADASQACTAQR